MWEVYAYWNVEMLELVFNAVASLTSNLSYLNLLVIVALLGFLAAVGVAMARIRGEEPIMWMFFMAFFYSVLIVPKTTVAIIDRTASAGSAPRVVSNVPLGLAAFAGTTSKIGDWLTRQYETLFSVPDEIRFKQGMTFGAKLIRAATGATLLDTELTRDMLAYMQDCVSPDILTGAKSLETILKTENLWSEMGGTNPARLVWISGGAYACPDAYLILDNRLTNAVNQTHSHLAQFINSSSAVSGVPQATLNAMLGSQLPVAADILLRVSSVNSLDYVRQAVMVNLWREFPSAAAAMTNSPAAAQLAISEAQARATSQSSYATMAAIAEEALPKVRNAFQVLIMMVFPIVILLIIAAGHKGGAILKHYVLALLWVEMWPVLYAAVSYIMQVSGSGTSMGLLGGLAGPPASTGLSLMNSAFIADEMLRTEGIAGMLTLLVIPFSAALLWGGAYAMTSIAASVMVPASSAAQSAGAQAGMGKFDAGSITYDMVRTNMRSGNTLDTRYSDAQGPTASERGGGTVTQRSMGEINGPAASIRTQDGAPVAMTPVGGAGAVNVQGGIARQQTSSSGREVAMTSSDAARLLQNMGARYTQGADARVAESFAQSVIDRITSGQSGQKGGSATRDTTSGLKHAGTAETGYRQEESDSYRLHAGVSPRLPGAGGAPVAGGAGALGLASGLLRLMGFSVGGQAQHTSTDTGSNALKSLFSNDAGQRRQAQQNFAALTQIMREIAASPKEERGVREVARNVAQALEQVLQASRQTDISVSDSNKAGVTSAQTQTGSFAMTGASNLAYYQALAASMGFSNPHAPEALQAAAIFHNANPQMAQALVAQAVQPSPAVLEQGGTGPQVTPEQLKTEGLRSVEAASKTNTAAVHNQNAEYQAAYQSAAQLMTGLNPTPDGKINAQSLYNRLDKERQALEGQAGAEARAARIAHGATAAAVRLVQEEMRRNGEDYGHIDLNRVTQVRDQILGAALGGPSGKGGNEQLQGELLKAADHDKGLHDARAAFIQHRSGIRWSEDGKRLEWGTKPEIKPAQPNPYANKGG